LGCRIDSARPILSRLVRQPSAAPPTVLAVDDDLAVRESLSLVLQEFFDVVLAVDGVEALETLARRVVDVVLLDLLMPRMDGRQALMHMRDKYPRTPVIVLTALADLPTVVQCVQMGAWNYVTKPWEDDTLVALVSGAARERRDEPGVLLVSDDVTTMAPLHLALERQTRVLETTVAGALGSAFQPTAIVLDSLGVRMRSGGLGLPDRFPKTPLVLMKAVGDALAQLSQLGVIEHELDRNPAVLTAVEFIAAHYREPLAVREVASAASVSPSHLAHRFPHVTGFSVQDYIARLRVNIARRLLVETTDTLETIAGRLGFADTSNFSRTFKNVDGIAPGEYRRGKANNRITIPTAFPARIG
jgi:CheY-like chemotaxis protein/AraC-like DNA-binding protein